MRVCLLGRVSWLLLLGFGARAEDSDTLNLGIGTQKVLTVPGLSRIAVGDPSVADVKTVGNNQVLVVGAGEGKTTLLIWQSGGRRKSYAVSVKKQDPNETINEIRNLLGNTEGITVRLLGDRIYLDGRAYSAQDAERLQKILSLYPGVQSLVKVTPNAKELIAQNLNEAFQKYGLPNVQANVVGSSVFLEGTVESPQDLQKAELIVRAIGEKVESLISVGIRRMILSEVQFVEVRRSAKDRFGLKYPTDITGTADFSATVSKGLFGSGPTQGTAGGEVKASSDFSAGFQSNDGYARVLAQPRLVCASGEQAEFLAGGELPIPLITNNQFTVLYKPYGVILKLRPTADRNGNIETEIEAETSEVDTSVAVSVGGSASVPGFRTRKVKTNVTVQHGETIVLSGVFSADEQKFVSKLPGIGSIPIIGELFKNRGFDSSKRELLIFVQPKVVNPDSERVRKLIDEAKTNYREAKGDVGFNLFD